MNFPKGTEVSGVGTETDELLLDEGPTVVWRCLDRRRQASGLCNMFVELVEHVWRGVSIDCGTGKLSPLSNGQIIGALEPTFSFSSRAVTALG